MAFKEQLWLRVVASLTLIQLGFSAEYAVEIMRMSKYAEDELIQKCAAASANFGGEVTEFVLTQDKLGCGVAVNPIDACSPITVPIPGPAGCSTPFAMVSRSNSTTKSHCKFSQQAFNVQNSSYPFKFILFYNRPNEEPVPMDGADKKEFINLPILMISYDCMTDIMKHFPYTKGYAIRVRLESGYYELFRYLIPFVVVIFFCFALFLITLCIRGCVERRKLSKRRLSKRNLKKIPVKKYRAGEEPDTCAICLEDFLTGEKLRHLPCRHVFHCKCIDVWLTQTRKVCPLCKRKIGSESDSDGSSEDLRTSNSASQPSTSYNQGTRGILTPLSPLRPSTSQRNPTTRRAESWSSQEALVDHDMVFVEEQTSSVRGMFRNMFRRLRRQNNTIDEESGAGLEQNMYHNQIQNIVSTDGDHLLDHEEPTSAADLSTSMVDSDLTTDTSSADTSSTMDTTITSNETTY